MTGQGRPPDDQDMDPVREYEDLVEQDTFTRLERQNIIDTAIRAIGTVVCWGAVILVAVIILQVVLRYGFSHGLVVLEELQWHLYAVGVMFGLSYALVTDSHIRVDLFHMQFSDRTRRWVEVFGILLLLLPFCLIMFVQSLDFLSDSWRVNERSDAPLGMCCRWAIKAVIPISMGLLTLAAVSRLVHDAWVLWKGREI